MQFTSFFSDWIAVLTALESSHIVDRWRHNFSQDCSQKMWIVQKSAEKIVRRTSYREQREF